MITPTKIIRSNRHTISIIITRQAELIVRAPLFCKDKQINDFLIKKQHWIQTKLNEIKHNTRTINFRDGERLELVSNSYQIIMTDKNRVALLNNYIYIPSRNSQEKLIEFLKNFAHNYINDRVLKLSKLYNFKYNSIRITSAKTRWGSCSTNNNLNFTYKLVLCPKNVVDYIIIHELSHTIIKNHSKKFYMLIKKIMPEYKQCEKWLKLNRQLVDFL